jgi:hypothetical protein
MSQRQRLSLVFMLALLPPLLLTFLLLPATERERAGAQENKVDPIVKTAK